MNLRQATCKGELQLTRRLTGSYCDNGIHRVAARYACLDNATPSGFVALTLIIYNNIIPSGFEKGIDLYIASFEIIANVACQKTICLDRDLSVARLPYIYTNPGFHPGLPILNPDGVRYTNRAHMYPQ